MECNQALLVIDMQYGLLQRKVFHKQELINNVNNLLTFFHEEDKQVFLIRHTNNSFSKENSDDWKVHNELKLLDNDIFINKKHSSVFKEKQFISLLNDKHITSVVIVGLISNGCIQAACLDAKKQGFSVILISDGHSTFHKDGEKNINYWNQYLQNEGIQLISVNDFINLP